MPPPLAAIRGDVLKQLVGEPGPVQPDQHVVPERSRQPGDRQVQQGDIVVRAVGGRVTRARVNGQHVAGVVAGREVRAEPDAALIGRLRVLFLRAREHDRRIQVNHRDPGQFLRGDLQPREPLRPRGQQFPPVAAEL